MEKSKKWRYTNLGMIFWLLLFCPYGLYLMFKYAKWEGKIKFGILGFFVLAGIVVVNFPAKETTPVARTYTQASTPSAHSQEPQPVEIHQVGVTSQIVKKVDGKYRYFFDIRNNDTKDFEGDVRIALYNELQQSPLGEGTFSTNKPIEPTLGASQYIDIYTGPVSVHGGNGISKFKFAVKKNGQTVNEGERQISTKYEDIDSYSF